MIRIVRFGSSLAFLILAALTGLVGFYIVYQYASFERPIQRFAVVIDAGSTQTRSNLYAISLNPSGLQIADADGTTATTGSGTPVSNVVQVREVAGCVNGGPLAAIESPEDANRLLGKCSPKFARKIKQLDFLDTLLGDGHLPNDEDDHADDDDEDRHLDSEEVDRQMALLNHRVNSVTHIHLGATAGMRALELLDHKRAAERIHWMRNAISLSNSNLLAGTVFMNPGFVGIIEGTSEASFGWLSVNFACDKLQINNDAAVGSASIIDKQHGTSDTKYSIQGGGGGDDDGDMKGTERTGGGDEATTKVVESVGTLELGGASAQMAFQVRPNSSELKLFNGSLEENSLELFGNNYKLATRSDLCLGMSQAILRTNYILLREYFDQPAAADRPPTQMAANTRIEIENPCQQNGSRSSLSAGILDSILNGACLEVSPDQKNQSEKFKQFIVESSQASRLQIVGTGNVDRCARLLSKLIEPEECGKLFSLCPESKNKQRPPAGMPFVTISGYNKALQVLNLSRGQLAANSPMQEVGSHELIGERLGGHPIDYAEFEQKTRGFCSMDVKEFPMRYPKMNKHFYDVNCLQLVYIRMLLTEFYQFRPETASWNQIRFLLFPIGDPEQQPEKQTGDERKKKKNIDIGWTLGLLLNATSWELSSENGEGSKQHDTFFHHGASVQFIIKTTVFLMFACVLIAASIVVCSLVLARRKYRSAYICHSAQSVTSTSCNQRQISPQVSL